MALALTLVSKVQALAIGLVYITIHWIDLLRRNIPRIQILPIDAPLGRFQIQDLVLSTIMIERSATLRTC